MTTKRILMTGAGGFVGAVLARRLLADGHEVHVLLKSATTRWRLADVAKDLRSHEVDLKDEEAVRRAAAIARPEVIYHLAAHGAYPFQTDPDGIIATNILGTWNLIKALSKTDYEAFVSAGSSSEYGFKEFAMRESDLLEPNSYYAVAKCAQTLLCQHTARTEQRPITTLRLFSAYGPYEEPSRLVPTLVRRCLRNEDLDLVPPETARDFVYVDDVVDAFLRIEQLARLGGRGEIINLGTGVQSTIRDVVDAIVRHTGARVECRWGKMQPRVWDSSIWVADCTRAKTLLGWQAKTSLSDGLLRTVEFMRSRGSEVS
jgi:nucleoside-diphosphate-sugar epimerase